MAAREPSGSSEGDGVDVHASRLDNGDTTTILSGECASSGELALIDVSDGSNVRLLTYAWLSTHVRTLAIALERAAAASLCCQPVALVQGSWCAESVAAMLAIWKVNAVYCPVDANWPDARVQSTLVDARPLVLLCCRHVLGRLALDGLIPVVSVEDGRIVHLPKRAVLPEPPHTLPSGTHYLLFTSGTTGRPKAVCGSRTGLASRLQWGREAYGFKADEVAVASTAPTFIDSFMEVLGALDGRCPLVLPQARLLRSPQAFLALVRTWRVSRLTMVPTALTMLLETLETRSTRRPSGAPPPPLASASASASSLPHLRLLCSSGEALTTALVERVRRQLPAVRLINLYGTSECSADVLCFECLAGSPGSSGSSGSSGSLAQPPAYGRHDGRRDERSTGGLVPLGHPISGARVRLLAPQQEQGFEDEVPEGAHDGSAEEQGFEDEVPEGELGEVWVGGEVVALGYLGQPQLTAAHFRRSRSIRWFRTGDLGRREARTGMVHFHGRADAQLQLRGYRVEPLEVEAVFTRMPGVLQAVVVPLRAPAQAAAFPFESALGPDEPPGSAVAGVEFGPPGSAVALMLLCTLAHEGTISGAVLGAPDEGCNQRSSEVISAHYEGTISGAVLGAPDEGCNQRSSEVISAHYEGTISGGGAVLEGGTGSAALSTALSDDGRAPVDLCGLRVRPAASSRAMHSAFEAWGLAQLPSWMIPSSFVILDTLPRLG